MPSYKKLAVFALAASTVYPALAAPIRYEKPRTGSSGRSFTWPSFASSPKEAFASSPKEGKITPPENPKAPPVSEAPPHPEALADPKAPADPPKSSLLKTVGFSAAAAAFISWYFGSGSAVPAGVPAPAMKRTTETSESQPITEMEGRALGAYKLDKRVSNLAESSLASLAGVGVGRMVRKDLSLEGIMLSHREFAAADVLEALSRYFTRAIDELD